MKKEEIIESIRKGEEKGLRHLYSSFRSEFLYWAQKKFSAQEEEVLDAFQETVVIFYEKVLSGELTNLSSSIKTYLFAIGRNRLYKQSGKEVLGEEMALNQKEANILERHDVQFEANEQGKQLIQLVERLQEPCGTILKLYYFAQFSMESIAAHMGYKGSDVAKAQKNRCMKKLREMASPIFKAG